MHGNFSLKKYIKNNNIFIIAEIGLNHNGNVHIAEQMIEKAKEAGVDAVKFQTYNSLKRAPDGNHEIKKILQNCELNFKEHQKLMELSSKLGLIFFSTVFDLESLRLLEKLNVTLYKISSFDISNTELLKHVAQTQKPTIISTGMASKKKL